MNFHLNQDCGQLWLEDRRWLYNTVLELQPVVALEVGTWRGGGSTFFIASALAENGFGILHTIEKNAILASEASSRYIREWPRLLQHVHFHFGGSEDMIPLIAPTDFVFLDGAQDPAQMLREFELVKPHLRVGGVLMAHDWFNGKADDLKPVLELESDEGRWMYETIGDGTGSFEDGSVGMAKATRLRM